MFAFLPTLGFQEMFVLVLLGVMLYGRNLPEVGRKVGKTVAQLRRGLNEFKAQMDRDESFREVRDTLRETRDEVRRAGTVPRALTDPTGAMRDMARDAMSEATAEAAAEADRTRPEDAPTVTPEPAGEANPPLPPEGKSDA